MAVEIPVIIDIDQAFQEAASRVSAAIRPMQQKIDESVLEVPIEINKKGDIKEVLDFVGKTSLSMNDLKYAIKSASSELARLKKTGASQQDLDTYTKAIALLKGIRAEWQINERLASQVGDAELRNLQIEQQYNEALRMSANTLNNINAKIAGYTAMLNNSDIGSTKFQTAAIELGKMSRELQNVQAQIKVLGTASGSVDNLNARLQQMNQQWNQMARSKKFTADGKLTAEAQALYIQYKKVTEELRKQGLTMSEMLSKEQQRAQKHQQYLTNRKKENAILNTTIKTVDALQAKINVLQSRLNKTPVGSSAFGILNQKLRETQRELVAVQQRMSATGVEMEKADMTFGRLLKRSAYFFGLHAVTRFLRNIREVTAEFELQRVALVGIIQDSEEANSLFRQIKAAAIQSPFEIKDLVSYTKQLSAYRVETENLFDVTMRLADVSAGLGVDMSRLILAYGQVRAASVLRGQELRQFTEAGIPLVELLAKKFTELNGRMVSTAEVFDLISKRAVPFEMISEIFEDMTDKGGTFYKMQEKQAETLAGQWANLKDALSIMYDEIGNTDAVHNAMTSLISDAKNLMQNWRSVATVLKTVGGQFVLMKVASLFLPTLTYNTQLAEKATAALARAQQLETAQQTKSNAIRGLAIKQLNAYSRKMMEAAAAQTLMGRGLKQIAASFLGSGWISLAITALSVLAGWFISARQEANRLNKELEKIGTDGSLQINRSVANFQRLANAAVEAADGSNEQNDALAELQRTYGDIIPSQNLEIDKLKELKGNYESLTEAIEQKINMQIREQKVNATTDAYAKDIQKNRKVAKNLLLQYGLDKEQINAVMDEVQKAVDSGLIGVNTSAADKGRIFEDIIKRLTGIVVDFGNGFRDYEGNWRSVSDSNDKALKSLNRLAGTYLNLHSDVDSINREMENSVGTMGIYADSWDKLKEAIKGVTVSEEEFGKRTTFAFKKEKIRKEVELMVQAIEEAFEGTNIDISKAFDPKGTINFEFLNQAAADSNRWGLQSFIKHIQESYEAVVPTNQMVSVVERKFQEIANQVGLSMDAVQGYLLRGEKDMKDYTKEIASDLEEAKHKVVDFQKRAEDFAKHPGVALPVSDNDVSNANKMVEFLTILSEWLSAYAKQTKPRGTSQTDPFITQMQERIKFMQDFKKGYDDLRKYMTSSQALSEEAGVMLGRGTSLGMSAEEQARAASDLSKWYDDAIKAVQDKLKAKGVKGISVTDFLGIDTTKKSKDIQDLQKLLQSLWDAKTDFDISQKKKDLEDALKKLSDEIKRSETARNFYNDILDLTGDEQLAATLGVSIYGDVGKEFKGRLQDELNKAMETVDASAMTDELRQAFSTQNFSVILANLDKFPEEWQKRLKEMAASSETFQADRAKELVKALERAKTYGEQRVEIAKKTAQRTAQIQAMDISDNAKNQLLKQNAKNEAEDSAKLAYEAFKDTPMYIELFADLDAASGRMLRNMRENLEEMKQNWKDLHPRELKELQSRLNELDEQIARRNPFKALVESIKQYRELQKQQTRAEADQAAVDATQKYVDEQRLLDVYAEEYNAAVALGKAGEADAMVAKEKMEVQAKVVDLAKEEAEEAQNTANSYRVAAKHITDAAEKMQDWAGYVSDSLDGIGQIVSTFASDDVSETFDIIAEGIGKTIGGASELAMGLGKVIAGDFTGIVDMIKGSGDLISGIFGTKSQLSIKAINKKIDEQDRLLSQLSYSYGRLEAAMAKAFGSDYIYNYNEQLKNLQAQQAAYEEQAELESQKGKKKDEQKIEEYKQSAKEVEDQMLDMRGQLAEFFAGSDLTSAAEDFANAWIDAYMEFGSTTDAISEKFKDMVNNMIVKSLAGKAMQNLLRPIFDEIDSLAIDGELTAAEIGRISAMATAAIPQINDAMTGLMNNLTTAGIDLRTHAGQFTGISRDIAGASEESILGLAAAVNTANFYISHVPAIAENVAAIRGALVGDTPANVRTTASEGPTYEDQMLGLVGSIPQMRDDMAAMRSMLERVIKPVGVSATHYVAVR